MDRRDPALLISLVLLIGGFSRSLQFTSLSAITYADMETRQIGAATGMATVAQQVSVSFGVAIGAMVLEASEWLGGRHTPAPADFSAAFIVVGLLSSLTSPRHAAPAGQRRRRHQRPQGGRRAVVDLTLAGGAA